ncbi:MAG: hypothetical protein J5922_00265 [Clostridia bacterium]|nr:hypothetical protein [Clostridia bacterium]
MKFFKENSYSIVKLILNQLAMTVFAILLTALYRNPVLAISGSIFSIAFYLFLSGTVVYEIGAKDSVRIEAGRAERMPLKGLFISLIAAIPNLILGIMIYVSSFFGGDTAKAFHGVVRVIANFWESMYLEFLSKVIYPAFPNHIDFCYILIAIPAVIVCTLVYYFAQKGTLVFRSKKDAE